jgi:hypothetical protein
LVEVAPGAPSERVDPRDRDEEIGNAHRTIFDHLVLFWEMGAFDLDALNGHLAPLEALLSQVDQKAPHFPFGPQGHPAGEMVVHSGRQEDGCQERILLQLQHHATIADKAQRILNNSGKPR